MNQLKNLVILIGLIGILSSSVIASAGSLSDGTGDVYYWTGVGTAWSWKQNVIRNNIDITSISSTINGEKITISMTVAGTIQESEKFGYYFYYNTSDTNYFVMMMGGSPIAMGIREGGGEGAYSSGEPTVSGNTISAEFDVLGNTDSTEIWGYAAEWSEVGPDAVNSEWWGDWAPDTRFTGEIEDDDDITPPDDEDDGTGNTTTTPKPPGTPGFEFIVLIAAFGLLFVAFRKRR